TSIADGVVGSRWVLIIAALVILYTRRHRAHFLLCFSFFILPIAIFFNLYLVHSDHFRAFADYYAFANGFLLVICASLACLSLLEEQGRKSWVGYILLLTLVTLSVLGYFKNYYPIQEKNFAGLSPVAVALDKVTQPMDVPLVYGLDWSPELAYLSQRRMFMVRFWSPSHVGLMKEVVARIGIQKISALVICGDMKKQVNPIEEQDATFGLRFVPYFSNSDCDIYALPPRQSGAAAAILGSR